MRAKIALPNHGAELCGLNSSEGGEISPISGHPGCPATCTPCFGDIAAVCSAAALIIAVKSCSSTWRGAWLNSLKSSGEWEDRQFDTWMTSQGTLEGGLAEAGLQG